jgi:glycosyltransferase involved in cell wall biosynthesis
MKILMTADTVGGVFTYAVELSRALGVLGVEVVLATKGGPLSASQRKEVSSLQNTAVFESSYRLEWQEQPWADVHRAGQWLLELEAQTRADLIHLNDYAHGQLPFAAPKLVVAHSCVASWFEAVHGKPLPAQWAAYHCEVSAGLRGADLVVAVSRAMAEALHRHYSGVGETIVIHNARSHAGRPVGPKARIVASAGRLWDEAKNVAAVEQAAPAISWGVEVAGDDEGLPPPPPRVRRCGVLPSNELAQLLARASIYALPARYEPFGLSVLEAALAECALVLGDIPSLRELWEGCAVLIDPDDTDALAAALNVLIDDTETRRRLGRAARLRALSFSPERQAAAYRAVYRSLLERRKAKGAAQCAS